MRKKKKAEKQLRARQEEEGLTPPQGHRFPIERVSTRVRKKNVKIAMMQNRLEGIGLFHTEFLLLETASFPGEEEQHKVYKKIIEAMGGRRIVMRTFNIGEDKRMHYIERCTNQNPALGVRGIRRHLLRHPDELRTQLRALLRAAAGSSIDVLFHMITTTSRCSSCCAT